MDRKTLAVGLVALALVLIILSQTGVFTELQRQLELKLNKNYARVDLVYDPGSNPLSIVYLYGSEQVDISTTTTGRIVAVPSISATINFQNMIDSDQVQVKVKVQYGQATYGGASITLDPYPYGTGQTPDPLEKTVISGTWSSIKNAGNSQTITVDGKTNLWGRMSYLASKLVQSPPDPGATKELRVPVTIFVIVTVNGVVTQQSQSVVAVGTVKNIPPSASITITSATVSGAFSPLNVIPR
jgi:hypothetical protein